MRILHVIPQFPYFGEGTIVGGHASSLLAMATAQANAGHEVTLVSRTSGESAGRRMIGPNFELVSICTGASPGKIRFGVAFLCEALSFACSNSGRFDVVHGHSGFADYIPVSEMIGRRLGLPTVHSMYCPVPIGRGRWSVPGVRHVILRAAARLDGLTGISANVAESLRRLGVDRDDLDVLYPAVDVDRFSPGDGRGMREALGIDPADPVVLFVGNTKPQKNLAGVIEAFALVRRRLPRARLVVTTELKRSSSSAGIAEMSDRIATLGLGPAVSQMGIVRDMPGLMRACDVLVAPFLDSFGPSDYFMAALEAMTTGKPVVVSGVGGMKEVVTRENGRLVDPTSVESIASGVEELLMDRTLRETIGLNARETIRERFSPGRVLAACERLYESIGAKRQNGLRALAAGGS